MASQEEFVEEEEEDYDESGIEEDAKEEEGNDIAGIYNSCDVNDQVFEELHMNEDVVQDVQSAWEAFLKTRATRDAAGEALYAAVFGAAPSLQSLFKTPRAVMAMRFINGLSQIVSRLSDPAAMKVVVETLGFQHLELEVTVPRVVIFREAIADLLEVELGAVMTTRARGGLMTLLNYVGGAYIYIRVRYAERLTILSTSWATANNPKGDESGEAAEEAQEKKEPADQSGRGHAKGPKGRRAKEDGSREGGEQGARALGSTSVPTTYKEMFTINAAVMGFGDRAWMGEVLLSFDAIVSNVSNSGRLQEECDVLSLRISKHKARDVALSEYKAVMLASLRSLVPRDWNSAHEVAWSWLWENVERLLGANLGQPAAQQRALAKLLAGLEEGTRAAIRRDVYSTFFSLAPAGQDFFKQSTTRLHFIADRIVAMTLEMYRDPDGMVRDLSALGLRHVGYGIPTELVGPFVTACVQVVRSFCEDERANEAFRWSLGLVSRILTRVISEGSTIVMKAINRNSARQLRKAVACAPRSERALWMLNIQVGTQSISPLLWAIETGSLEAAGAMLADLLTIRADRDRYYYGMDALFERHPDIVRRLVQDAPGLLGGLFDGLIWRSRTTEGGMRRVNYYIRHLVVDADGGFAKTIEWIVENGDPKIVCHPVIAMVTDVMWSRVAFSAFLCGKAWPLLTLVVFIIGAAAFDAENSTEAQRIVTFSCRAFVYLFSLCPRIYAHVKRTCVNYRSHETVAVYHIPLPRYLTKWQDAVCLLLTLSLVLMLVFEPVLACLGGGEDFEGAGLFTQVCPAGKDGAFAYSVLVFIATCLYFLLTIDLSVFSMRVSAFVLICFRVVNEVWLYILGMGFVILTFSCGIAALRPTNAEFGSIAKSALSLTSIALMMFGQDSYSGLSDDPALQITVVVYIIVVATFLFNLLIAQMNCTYRSVYEDMVGYARLNRGKVVTESMQSVSAWRWERFVQSLRFDEPCEFGEGDVGLPGAIQVLEPASQNVTTVDSIRRFGGSTSPSAQWPEHRLEASGGDDDRLARMERLVERAVRKMSSRGRRGGSAASGSCMASSIEHSSSGGGSASQASGTASEGR